MLEAAGGAVIAETGGEAGQEVELGSGLAQEQGTAVGGGGRAAEVGNHKSAMVRFVLRDADLYRSGLQVVKARRTHQRPRCRR